MTSTGPAKAEAAQSKGGGRPFEGGAEAGQGDGRARVDDPARARVAVVVKEVLGEAAAAERRRSNGAGRAVGINGAI